MLTFTFKDFTRWNRWVRQFSYILKSGIGMRFGSKLTGQLLHNATLRMLLLQMTPGLQMQEHLFHSLLSHNSNTIAQLSTFSFRH
jgi:hypothetical protein